MYVHMYVNWMYSTDDVRSKVRPGLPLQVRQDRRGGVQGKIILSKSKAKSVNYVACPISIFQF